MPGHISDPVRAQLAKLGPDKKARVLDVADERRELAEDRRGGAPAAKSNLLPSDDE